MMFDWCVTRERAYWGWGSNRLLYPTYPFGRTYYIEELREISRVEEKKVWVQPAETLTDPEAT